MKDPGEVKPEIVPGWFAMAMRPAVVRRSLGYAVVVGAILITINHADAILRGDLTPGRLAKMGLTVIVPYLVSTLSSVGAMREARRGASVLMLLLVGCASSAYSREGELTPAKIELLGIEGCAHTPAMRDNLRAALGPERARVLIEVNQESVPESDLRRLWPTPMILVDDRDLFGRPAPSAPAMGCRMYPEACPASSRSASSSIDSLVAAHSADSPIHLSPLARRNRVCV